MISSDGLNAIDWAVLALTGAIALVSLFGALYVVPWTAKARAGAPTKEFNFLWTTRCLLQLLGACYALSLDLRLQVLWSYHSAIKPGGFSADDACRAYIAVSLGLLEPAFLLLVLFASSFAVNRRGASPDNPNLFILALTVGLTLPMCAAQVFAALFSRIITQLSYNEELMRQFFAASLDVSAEMCPQAKGATNCSVCVFPEFSTLISGLFAVLYLLVLWYVLGRVANAAINKILARRIRLLQICISFFFCASLALRGVSVLFHPYTVGFVALSLANAVVVCTLILSVSFILVWKPVYDGRVAGQRVLLLQGGPNSHGVAEPQPTELQPLVMRYHHGDTGHGSAAGDGASLGRHSENLSDSESSRML